MNTTERAAKVLQKIADELKRKYSSEIASEVSWSNQEARSGSLELLAEGTPLKPGDEFLHPDYPDFWTDYECRPDIFRGAGERCSWYHVSKNDVAHTWPWRRRVDPNDQAQRRPDNAAPSAKKGNEHE